ncbi:TetR family transcriptional regulator [Arthrobacter sp. ISL-65]|nr:TetR/AcrR family transcriptional regulator [Arthrobacter sp. ISL-65]MBT2548922.1 TetR family transcriptional regulator [Arthrobacter sp. ISL-65]
MVSSPDLLRSAVVPPKARRRGRPPTRVLHRDCITDAALSLTTSAGYEGLTVAALARNLDVAKSALYNHVASKQDVLRLMEERLISQVDVAGFGCGPWDEAMRRWAWSYRDVFSKHTPLIPVIAVLPVADAPRTLEMYEAVSSDLAAAGIPNSKIVPSIVAIESLVFGAAFDVDAPPDVFDGCLGGFSPSFAVALQAARAAEIEEPRHDAAFNLGVEALLEGLKALLT